jgi:calcium-dependent protein kinase
MVQCDVDGNGFLEYTEFVAATMNRKKMLSMEQLKKAFSQFDLDGNGLISFDELKHVLGNSGNIELIF